MIVLESASQHKACGELEHSATPLCWSLQEDGCRHLQEPHTEWHPGAGHPGLELPDAPQLPPQPVTNP